MKEKIKKALSEHKECIGNCIEDVRDLQHAAHESVEAGTFGEEKRKHSEKEDAY